MTVVYDVIVVCTSVYRKGLKSESKLSLCDAAWEKMMLSLTLEQSVR